MRKTVSLNEKVEKLERNVGDLKEEKKRLASDLSSAQKQLTAAKREAAHSDKECSRLKDALGSAKLQLSQVSEVGKSLKRELTEEAASTKKYKATID